MDNKILLTDEEINTIYHCEFLKCDGVALDDTFNVERAVALAQHKKDVEWLEEPCTDHILGLQKRNCSKCWQAFKGEVER